MRVVHITDHGAPEDVIEIADVPAPAPDPNEVRIRVHACALNHLDVFARKGHPEDESEFPKRTGCDIVGEIDCKGEAITNWSNGDRVTIFPGISCDDCEYCLNGEQTMCHNYQIIGEDLPGGLAEYLIVPASVLEPVPEHLSDPTAAAWPVTFTTAWRMLITGGELRPSESALILGASGGVGNAALQIAARLGAEVYATTSNEQKAERLTKWIDRDRIINYTEEPFDERIMDLTKGRGVDLIADHVGEVTWQQSINSLAMGGRMVICGATSGPDPNIDIRSVYQHHRKIIGAPMGNRQDFRDVGRLIASGELEPLIDRVIPVENISEGHRAIENREVTGKVVVDFS